MFDKLCEVYRTVSPVNNKHICYDYLKSLKSDLIELLDLKNLNLINNLYNSIYLSFKALDMSNGKIITTAINYVETINAIEAVNSEPVFCDLDYRGGRISVIKLEQLIKSTPDIKGIIITNCFGNVCDIQKIEKIGDEYNIPIIFISSSCLANKNLNDQSILNYGTITVFDFRYLDFNVLDLLNISGIICKNYETILRIEQAKNLGFNENSNIYESFGINALPDVLSCQSLWQEIDKLFFIKEKKKNIFCWYNNNLKNLCGLTILNDTDNLINNCYNEQLGCYLHINPFQFKENVLKILNKLLKNNIKTEQCYYPLISNIPYYRKKLFKKGYDSNICNSWWLSGNTLSLPTNINLTRNDVDNICDLIIN